MGLPNDERTRLPAVPNAVVWRPDEVAIVVEMPSLFVWLQRLEETVDAIAPIFETVRSLVLMPRREGRIALPYAMRPIVGRNDGTVAHPMSLHGVEQDRRVQQRPQLH